MDVLKDIKDLDLCEITPSPGQGFDHRNVDDLSLHDWREHPTYQKIQIALAIWRIDRHPLSLHVLTAALHDKSSRARRDALTAIAEIGAPAAVIADELATLTHDPRASIRYEAVTALAATATHVPGVMAVLIGALKDRDPIVCAQTATVLGNLGPAAAPAIPSLLRLTAKRDRKVQLAAARALWKIARHEMAITTLVAMLERPSGDVFEYAAIELTNIGPPARRALPILLKLRSSPEVLVQYRAYHAIESISGRPGYN